MDLTIEPAAREARPGDVIPCKMQVRIKRKTRIKRIEMIFIGEFVAIDYNHKTPIVNRNVFVRLVKALWTPGDGETAAPLGPGTLDFEASVAVPGELMPSFPPGGLVPGSRFPGVLNYQVRLVVIKSFGFDEERSVPVLVRNDEFMSVSTDHRKAGSVPATRKAPAASISLDKSVCKPGDVIDCHVVVEKLDAACKIQGVQLALRNRCWGWADKRWHHVNVFVDTYDLGSLEDGPRRFSLLVPGDAALTIYGGNVKITWDVHLRVQLALARDLQLTVPVIVAGSDATIPVEALDHAPVPAPASGSSHDRFCPACGASTGSGAGTCDACGSELDDT